MLRERLSVRLLLVLAWLALASVALAEAADPPAEAAPAPMSFTEMGVAAGVRFVHSSRDFGDRHKAEVLEMFTDGGAAVAVGDFDNDGWDDMFVTDSNTGKKNHLMRNNGDLTFTDVAEQAGVADGNDPLSIVADAVWFDYDNDGLQDLLVGRFGTPILYHNDGKVADSAETTSAHRFSDVSEAAGLTKFGNTIAIITFDADGDGWLDIMLGNYFKPLNLLDLDTPYVMPNNLDYAVNGGGVTFWRNIARPDGSRGFVEETEAAGFAHHTGWTLDLGHADLNNDGLQDVYIAGDYGTDRLFFNQGTKGNRPVFFREVTEAALGGFDTRKGMNVDMGDYDRNGALDIYVTNITDEYMKECNMLWHNNGDGTFLDLGRETGTCDTDWGWGAKWGDYDNDGWQDIFAVCGLRSRDRDSNYIPVLLEMIITPDVDFSDVNSYPDIGNMTWSGFQKERMFRNLGDGTFEDVAAAAGVDNELDGRGVGVGDFDRDGRLDIFQANANQMSLFYVNRTEGAGNWIELDLIGDPTAEQPSNRDAIGARLTVVARAPGGGEQSWIREVDGGNSYAAASTKRLHFGLGTVDRIERIEVRWPGGATTLLEATEGASALAINQIHELLQGEAAKK